MVDMDGSTQLRCGDVVRLELSNKAEAVRNGHSSATVPFAYSVKAGSVLHRNHWTGEDTRHGSNAWD